MTVYLHRDDALFEESEGRKRRFRLHVHKNRGRVILTVIDDSGRPKPMAIDVSGHLAELSDALSRANDSIIKVEDDAA